MEMLADEDIKRAVSHVRYAIPINSSGIFVVDEQKSPTPGSVEYSHRLPGTCESLCDGPGEVGVRYEKEREVLPHHEVKPPTYESQDTHGLQVNMMIGIPNGESPTPDSASYDDVYRFERETIEHVTIRLS